MELFNSKKRVKITHVINPNRFYLCDLEYSAGIKVLQEIEQKLQKYCSSQEKQKHKPNNNEVVGYFSAVSEKWIRCEVEEINKENNHATLWALDYGVPMTTLNPDKLMSLPEEYQFSKSPIRSAGLKVLPAQQCMNNKTKKVEQVVQERWSEEAVKYFKKLISSPENVYFCPSQSIQDEEILFGELIVEKTGESIKLSQKLVEMEMATVVPNQQFLALFDRSFSAIIERWNDNTRSGEAMNPPDTVMFTGIASKTSGELPRKLLKSLVEKQTKQEIEDEIKQSIEKVKDWRRKNDGIPPDNIEYLNEEYDDSVAASNTQIKPAETAPNTQALTNDSLAILKDRLPLKIGTLSLDTKRSTWSSESKRPPRKMILVPAGASLNTNLKSPPLIDENFQKITEAPASPSVFPSIHKPIAKTLSGVSVMKDGNERKLSFDSFALRMKQKKAATEEPLKENGTSDLKIHGKIAPNSFLVEHACNENWMRLEIGLEYFVHICAFGSCSSFYVQIIDDSDGWDEMMELLRNVEVLKPLKDFAVGKMCLVETLDQELNRAKIIRASESSVMCFCIDNAELVHFHNEKERIYEIPLHILNHMPFQAVNCRLSGIKALSDYAWTKFIYKKVVKRICQQRLRVVKKLGWNPDLIPTGLENISSYEVVVFEKGLNDEDVTLADKLVKCQLADYDKVSEASIWNDSE